MESKQKNQVRELMRERFKSMKLNYRKDASTALVKHLSESELWSKSKNIALFFPLPTEPDCMELYHMGHKQSKRMAFPRVNEKSSMLEYFEVSDLSLLVKGALGTKEPHPLSCPNVVLNELDLVIVPGVAFDKKANRLGRGKGFFDRVMADRQFKATTVGCFFSFQEVELVPTQEWDRPLNYVVTECALQKPSI